MTAETANVVVIVLLTALWCLGWALWLQRWPRSADAFRLACELEAAKDVLGMRHKGGGVGQYRTAFDRAGWLRRSTGARLRKNVRLRRDH